MSAIIDLSDYRRLKLFREILAIIAEKKKALEEDQEPIEA